MSPSPKCVGGEWDALLSEEEATGACFLTSAFSDEVRVDVDGMARRDSASEGELSAGCAPVA